VLPASTYPLEIVQAARFLEEYEQDSTLQPNEDWDESVTALLNYPEVLRMLNDDIDWTWRLGDAVVNQQADVIAAVESFRDRAYAAGNLKSDQRQTVSEEDGIIEIVPIDDEIIYVPYYEPEQVVVRQVTPVYYYYPRPYPVYYYPYPVGYSFYSGYFWGVTTAFQIGWATDHLHVHHHSYWGHPYFGHSYYGHYYRSPSYVYNSWYVHDSVYYTSNRYRDGDYWRPRTHSRARPAYYSSRTRSYRDSDVSRESSARGYGNAYTSQALSRDVRSDSRSDSRTDSRIEPIRFRERSENRQMVRRDSAAGATRAGTTTRTDARTDSRTESRTTTRADSRRSPVTTTTNSNRESTRETVVRRPASGRSDSPVSRLSNSGDSRAEPRAAARFARRFARNATDVCFAANSAHGSEAATASPLALRFEPRRETARRNDVKCERIRGPKHGPNRGRKVARNPGLNRGRKVAPNRGVILARPSHRYARAVRPGGIVTELRNARSSGRLPGQAGGSRRTGRMLSLFRIARFFIFRTRCHGFFRLVRGHAPANRTLRRR
jgi:hypothetical protein